MRPEPTHATTELELAQARARADLLLALYTHADHDFQAAASELARAQGEVRRLTDEVAALKASTSWRVTGPLRMLGRLFGRSA